MSQTHVTAATLNAKFGRSDHLNITDRAGHTLIAVNTPAATGAIALQGAQILQWRPKAAAEVLWCAPMPPAQSGKAIRGGIPICWPWFGPHATDPKAPQHGLVRTHNWTLSETRATAAGAHITLTHSAFGCALRLDVEMGSRLKLSLSAHNTTSAPVTITEALHTYFHVANVSAAVITGLDGSSYRDNTDSAREKVQHGSIQCARETVAVFPDTPDVINIEDPGLKRRIRITRTGGRSTVVWHPGASVVNFADIPADIANQFVCVESGNVTPHAVTIAPGATHCLGVTYDLTPL
jgi:glucose-6-phosphate 1-epimerase